ncbi:hypothetical protein U9R90_18650 [Streptomyces sp. E11-3]
MRSAMMTALVKCKAKKAGRMRVYVHNGKLDGRTGRVASRYID